MCPSTAHREGRSRLRVMAARGVLNWLCLRTDLTLHMLCFAATLRWHPDFAGGAVHRYDSLPNEQRQS